MFHVSYLTVGKVTPKRTAWGTVVSDQAREELKQEKVFKVVKAIWFVSSL